MFIDLNGRVAIITWGVGLLGCSGQAALSACDLALVVPSDVTEGIQEAHIATGHAIMELVEDSCWHPPIMPEMGLCCQVRGRVVPATEGSMYA